MDKKGPYLIKELKKISQGTQIWGKYLVLEKINRKTKDGRDIINLKIGDSTGELDVIVWDNCVVTGEIENGRVIGLLGDMGSFNNRLQITAKRIKILDEDVSPYLRTPTKAIEEIIADFNNIIELVTDGYMRELLDRIFNEEMKRIFYKAPAAKKIHHNYSGGLMEHTLMVARLCLQAVDIYPELNKDLLLTGAILHDIGKVEEYKINVVPEYTVSGRMMGHIVLGSELVDRVIKEIRRERGCFPDELEMMIKHMILSHHGNLEYGSPVKPLFPEAFVLHMMDNLDAKLFVFFNKIEEEEEGEGLFTAYDGFFEQHFFKYRYKSEG